MMVRQNMPPVIKLLAGDDGIPYSIVLFVLIPTALRECVDHLALVAKEHGVASTPTLIVAISILTDVCLDYPSLVQTVARVLGKCSELRGCRDIAYTAGAGLGVSLLWFFYHNIAAYAIIFPNVWPDSGDGAHFRGQVDLVWLGIWLLHRFIMLVYTLFMFRTFSLRARAHQLHSSIEKSYEDQKQRAERSKTDRAFLFSDGDANVPAPEASNEVILAIETV